MITKTSAEAQNQFGQLLDTAQREPVVITRHGRPTVYVVSTREMEDYQEFQSARRKRLAADWQAWSKRARKTVKPEAAKLTDEDVVRMVHELR
jgi:antitoxin Phd